MWYCLLLLTSSSISLLSDRVQIVVLSPFDLLKIPSWPTMGSVLETVLLAAKYVYFVTVGWNILWMSIFVFDLQ